VQRRRAACERCRHHHVFSSGDGDFIEMNLGRAQASITGSARHDVSGFEFYFRAKRLESREVQIYRARADCTTAGQRDFRFAKASE